VLLGADTSAHLCLHDRTEPVDGWCRGTAFLEIPSAGRP
jgi:hypothetical protein